VENAGAITYGKPSEEKTLRYQQCMLKRNGLRRSVNDAHEQRATCDLMYTSRQFTDSRFEQLCSSRTRFAVIVSVAYNRRLGLPVNGAHEQ